MIKAAKAGWTAWHIISEKAWQRRYRKEERKLGHGSEYRENNDGA